MQEGLVRLTSTLLRAEGCPDQHRAWQGLGEELADPGEWFTLVPACGGIRLYTATRALLARFWTRSLEVCRGLLSVMTSPSAR